MEIGSFTEFDLLISLNNTFLCNTFFAAPNTTWGAGPHATGLPAAPGPSALPGQELGGQPEACGGGRGPPVSAGLSGGVSPPLLGAQVLWAFDSPCAWGTSPRSSPHVANNLQGRRGQSDEAGGQCR